jgi:hypothetical protein
VVVAGIIPVWNRSDNVLFPSSTAGLQSSIHRPLLRQRQAQEYKTQRQRFRQGNFLTGGWTERQERGGERVEDLDAPYDPQSLHSNTAAEPAPGLIAPGTSNQVERLFLVAGRSMRLR